MAEAAIGSKSVGIAVAGAVLLGAGAAISGQTPMVIGAFAVAGLVLGGMFGRGDASAASSGSSSSGSKPKPRPTRVSTPSGSGNAQFAVMIWFVNLLIAAALVFFAMKFLLAPPSPSMPSYVPVAAELPAFEPMELAEWEDITWTRTENINLRDVNAQAYLALHDGGRFDAADWNRREAFSMPGLKPPPDTTPPPVPQDPTLEEALKDLQGKIVVKAFMGPSHVVVAPKNTPNEEYILVDPQRWNRYLTDVDGSSSRGRNFDEVRGMLYNDLRAANLPLVVVAVGTHSWTVEYTYKNKAFTLTLGPPRAEGVPEVNNGETGMRTFADLITGDGSTPPRGGNRPPRGGSGSGNVGTPEPAPIPGGTITESQLIAPDVWVIAPDEVDNVRENMSSMIESLKPKSIFNREKREYEGIQLTEVPDDSLAQRRGFVAGDTVISINGVPVRSVTDVKNYVRNNKNLPQYVVVFDRGGKRQTRTFRIPNRN